MQYTPSDCFETFPFPGYATNVHVIEVTDSSSVPPAFLFADASSRDPGEGERRGSEVSGRPEAARDGGGTQRIPAQVSRLRTNELAGLEEIGERYYSHRQGIMLARQEGLTKTYNRFHNPRETTEDIARLRALHVEMDYSVARAYGWDDLDLGHGFHETKQGLRYTISRGGTARGAGAAAAAEPHAARGGGGGGAGGRAGAAGAAEGEGTSPPDPLSRGERGNARGQSGRAGEWGGGGDGGVCRWAV